VSFCKSAVELVLLLGQQQWQIPLAYTLVDVLDVVLKVTGNDIEPLHLMASVLADTSMLLAKSGVLSTVLFVKKR